MSDYLQLIIGATTDAAPRQPMMEFLWIFALIGLAFYFIIIRPQKREQKDKKDLISKVQKGDRVVTIGGIHGKVSGVDQTRNTVAIDVGKNIKIEFSRNSITSVEREGKKSSQESKEK